MCSISLCYLISKDSFVNIILHNTCAKFEISNTTKSTKNIYDHSNITGHSTTLYNFSIVCREEQNLSRLIKESMYLRVNCSETS